MIVPRFLLRVTRESPASHPRVTSESPATARRCCGGAPPARDMRADCRRAHIFPHVLFIALFAYRFLSDFVRFRIKDFGLISSDFLRFRQISVRFFVRFGQIFFRFRQILRRQILGPDFCQISVRFLSKKGP